MQECGHPNTLTGIACSVQRPKLRSNDYGATSSPSATNARPPMPGHQCPATYARPPTRCAQRCAAIEDSTCVLKFNADSAGKYRHLGERRARNGRWLVPTRVELQTRFVSNYPLNLLFADRCKDRWLRYVSSARPIVRRRRMIPNAGMIQELHSYDECGANSMFTMHDRELQPDCPCPPLSPLTALPGTTINSA